MYLYMKNYTIGGITEKQKNEKKRKNTERDSILQKSLNVNIGLNHNKQAENFREQRRLVKQSLEEGETEELIISLVNSKTNPSIPHNRKSISSYGKQASITTEGRVRKKKKNKVDIIPTPSSRGGKRKKKNKTRKK